MTLKKDPDRLTVSNFMYRLDVGRGHFAVDDPRTGHRLLDAGSPVVLYPELAGETVQWQVVSVDGIAADAGADGIRIVAAGPDGGRLRVALTCWPDHIEIAAEVDLRRAARVAHWHLLRPGTRLGLFHLHHWRNRHGHTSTYETCNLYQGGKQPELVASAAVPQEMRDQWLRVFDITTYSSDWQFNPRPSLLLFQRDSIMLGIGARDLPQGFGLELVASAHTLERMRYNYGGEYGLDAAAGTTIRAPRTYLWLDHHGSVWDTVDHYVALLQEDNEVPRRSLRDVPHWWLEPAYCTWNDQVYLSRCSDGGSQPRSAVDIFDASVLDGLLDVLEKEQYPFSTVIIDDGWQKARGDWIPHPTKFTNLRRQIDRIHAMGMKVILWIAPFDFDAEADIRARSEWLCGGGVLGRHGMPMVDFSDPRVQREYLEPLAHFLFASDRGCLDADGLKLDFMADKVHPVFPVHDPAWRGEERFSHAWQSMVYRLLKQWKPDGQMLGGTAHPHFIGCQDMVRTYDVPASQFQHADRAEMIRHFNPGNLVALDMGNTGTLADVEEHFDIALRHNLMYECGRIAPDPGTGLPALGSEYAPLLRRKLSAWGREGTGRQ